MPTIAVALPNHPYQVQIELGALAQLGQHLKLLVQGRTLLVVSHPQIYKRYGTPLTTTLTQAGFTIATCLIPAGERYKTPTTLHKIYDHCHQARLDRTCGLVALGGGVVGDLTGFAAATWMRGVPVVQVPTSLLAMVDAAIGGKTGLNTPHGKNLIGAFHQPALVVVDPQVLVSLPPREWRSGLAEVIKYGVIWDHALFELLEQQPDLTQRRLPTTVLLALLTRSCQAKAAVVVKDEREGGLRAVLNYGHTVGHAIETATAYRIYTHGEAVSLGMVAAGALAVHLGLWDPQTLQRQNALIAHAGLPTRLPKLDPTHLVTLMQGDKKNHAGELRFVLPTALGQALPATTVSPSVVEQVLQGLMT
ncbi:3-dehydroquinate synthase [Candidatus Cyanaurora vandensis]|uniref:3-dehydroquinate synthase n=1 Tax=Candidatus Cyanaurora vandensis TaxID=2714958 RepID=UPI00257B7BB9|nr:3-dehydroquinate synthase [Candidatus Cyanaurora vandensis]